MKRKFQRILFLSLIFLGMVMQSCSMGERDYVFGDGTEFDSADESNTRENIESPIVLPTNIPSITPTQNKIPLSYDLPIWFSDFDDTIVMTLTAVSEDESEITFINANRSDDFSIWIPNEAVSKYFWTTDGKAFGFLEPNNQNIYLVDVVTGQVSKHQLDSDAQRCLNEYLSKHDPVNTTVIEKMWVYGESPDSKDFFCEPANFADISKYSIEYVTSNMYVESIRIIEKESGLISEIAVADPTNGLYLLNSNWRENPSILAVLQGDVMDPELLDDRWRYSVEGDRILLFDLSTGKRIKTFEGQYRSLYWSPDNTKIFTQRDYLPCIIDLTSYEIKCLEMIKGENNSIHTDLFNWSKDSNNIYYAKKSSRGDICIYDLISDGIFCPTSELDILEGFNIEYYTMSFDDQFFIFSYGNSCSGCDHWGDPSSAIISRDGDMFYYLGKENLEYHFPFISSLIRPMIE